MVDFSLPKGPGAQGPWEMERLREVSKGSSLSGVMDSFSCLSGRACWELCLLLPAAPTRCLPGMHKAPGSDQMRPISKAE